MYREIPELAELLEIFRRREEELAGYFPELPGEAWICFGEFDTNAESGRFVALCALYLRAREGERAEDPELRQLCREICGLAHAIIETSASWPYLVWTPERAKANADAACVMDETLYRVWEVMRRLCGLTAVRMGRRELRPFWSLFEEVVTMPEGKRVGGARR